MADPSHFDDYRLELLGPELVSLARGGDLEFTYDRAEPLSRLAVLLKGKSVLVVGEEGVGKKSLVRALAYRVMNMMRDSAVAREEARKTELKEAASGSPSSDNAIRRKQFLASLFPFTAIYSTTPFTLDLGTPYAGNLGEKLHRVTKEAAAKRAIIFLESAHLAVGVGSGGNSPHSDVANTLASCLASHDFRMIATTTADGLARLRERCPKLLTNFVEMELAPVPREELTPWLQRFEAHLGRRYPIYFGDGFTEEVLDACDRFYSGMPYPAKALMMIRDITNERMAGEGIAQEWKAAPEDRSALNPTDIHKHIAVFSGLSMEMVRQEPVPRALLEHGLPEFFGSRIVGQPEAVDAAVALVARYRARLTASGKPVGVLWLAGTTGVGKTEFAKVVAEFFFGTRERLLRYDMSEFMDSESIDRLLGGGGGPAGSASSLVQKVRSQPFSVILFDEVEKANPRVLDLFLQILDEAKLTGRDGSVARFDNAIILLTSNLGAELFNPSMGFGDESPMPGVEQIRRVLEKNFRPELVNRIETIIPFRRLTKADVERILVREIAALGSLAGLQGIESIHLSPAIHTAVIEEGYQPRFGVRPLKRSIDTYLLRPVSFLLAAERPDGRKAIAVGGSPGETRFAEGEPEQGWRKFDLSS